MLGFPAEDWRDPAAYAGLARSARSRFAWEWLRRTPEYREAWRLGSHAAAARFQLHHLEDPDAGASGRPMWRAEILGSLLRADAHEAVGDDLFSLSQFAQLATLRSSVNGEHLLLTDGIQELRIDIGCGSLTQGPVALSWQISGINCMASQLPALRDFAFICRTRHMPPFSPKSNAARSTIHLRVHDALAAGACQQEIAKALLGQTVSETRWRLASPEARSRVQRLVAKVRAINAKSWQQFLIN